MAATALIAEKARAVVAYAEQFDFVQGELPLSSWHAPAVSHTARRELRATQPAGPAQPRAGAACSPLQRRTAAGSCACLGAPRDARAVQHCGVL